MTSASLRAEAATGADAEWDAFVAQAPGATLAHCSAWAQVLRSAYGLRPLSLECRDDAGKLAGVLPLALFRSLGGARELVSLPYLDGGGIAAASAEAEQALLEAALRAARTERARCVELRQVRPLHAAPEPDASPRVGLSLVLAADEQQQWQAIGAKVRNQTRKAQREGLVLAEGERADLLRDFYGVYAANMRDLGSPPHAAAFFAALAQAFGERLRVIVVRGAERAVGGLIAIEHAGTVHVPWASTLREERARCPNNLIYWEALRWAIARGARRFDFGRSPRGGGTYQFKRGWGAEEQPLPWLRLSPRGASEGSALRSDHALLQRLARLWVHVPVPVSTWLGARIRPYLAN